MKTLLLSISILLSVHCFAQRNTHRITPISVLGDTAKTITINNSLSLNDSTVYITIIFNFKKTITKTLKYPIAYFRPFPSIAALKVKVINTIGTDLGISILD